MKGPGLLIAGALAAAGLAAVIGSRGPREGTAAARQALPPRTAAAITAEDLSHRVHVFADDSMGGRLAGSLGNRKATDYIAAELERMGVRPAGDSGSYFQSIPAPRFGSRPNTTPDPRYRNVVAIIPGSDSTLRNEFIALGAHHDHIGTITQAVDHDSLRAASVYGELTKILQREPSQEELTRAGGNLDSLRRIRAPRRDSISNGADDDGSGSMALLEIAEYFAALPQAQRPGRSLLFVWHSNEEIDLGGSQYFVANPTVPLLNIKAQVNIDMIGRGGVFDVEGGGADYLALVGSRRISPGFGDMIDSVNAAAPPPARFRIDYSWDAPDHPERIYSRSDHYNYAQAGIPVVFVFTGLHADYHSVTDEPQYLDYSKLEKVVRFVAEVVKVAGNM